MDKPFTAKMSFEGRTALVTGGASGIGFAVTRQLAELGAKIAIAEGYTNIFWFRGGIQAWEKQNYPVVRP